MSSREVHGYYLNSFITDRFISKFLEIFYSKDDSERSFIPIILYFIYNSFINKRNYIISSLSNILYDFIYDGKLCLGVPNILSFYNLVVIGFIIPLRIENRSFFLKFILPLYRCNELEDYNEELTSVVTSFLDKDYDLLVKVIVY